MNWNDWVHEIIAGAVVSVFGIFTWLLRKVFTSEAKIALLVEELKRQADGMYVNRQIMQEVKEDLKEVKRDILGIYKNNDHNNSN